jgi:cell wall-associated NlpC family hydrolase
MNPKNRRALVQRGPALVKRTIATLTVLASLAVSLVSMPVVSNAAPSQSDVAQAQERLRQLEADFEVVSEEYNLVHERLGHLRAQISETELVVDKVKDRMENRSDAAGRLAAELYMNGGDSGAIEAVLTSDSIADIEERLHYLETSETEQSKVFERLAADNDLLDSKMGVLQEATAAAAKEEARLADLRSSIDEKVQSQQDEIASLNALIERAKEREAAAAAAAEQAAAEQAAAEQDAAITQVAPADSSSSQPVVSSAPAPSSRAEAAVQAALSQTGKPYVYGSAGPDSYDCSGLTMWSWAQAGVSLPHNSGAQYAATPRVSSSDWQPGDLLFFGSPIHHVAMYVGNGQMVEAPYTGEVVRVVSAYRSDYVGAGRPGV